MIGAQKSDIRRLKTKHWPTKKRIFGLLMDERRMRGRNGAACKVQDCASYARRKHCYLRRKNRIVYPTFLRIFAH